ncbi:MAG: lytic transglycosylase domain-containing protein [Paucibacter sp.]|nr:lytic transglycosylase domain-containing protein [Roseateles sp.]
MKLLVALVLSAAPLSASAELWGYVDGAGVARVATKQLNGSYSLIMGDPGGSDWGRVPGKQDASENLLTWLDIAPEVKQHQPLLREAAARNGVDMELLKAIITVESGYKQDAVSPRGALGLMQLTPDAGQRYAKTRDHKALLNPKTNVETGARMLADLIRRFGRIDAALAAWNAGEGTVRRAGNRVPDIAETQAHVQLVLELYWALLQRSLPATARQLRIETQ